MAIVVPATGDQATAAWADSVANQLNALPVTARGSASGTTDTSGQATITHTSPSQPTYVFVQNTMNAGSTSAAAGTAVDSITSTTFRVRFSGVVAAVTYSIFWQTFV